MAATSLSRRIAGLLGSLLGALGLHPAARAVDLPEQKAEALYHLYKGGGVTADGPAFLVRKTIADKVSLSAGYYMDAVSNASIDVVTTASPFKETRNNVDFGADYAYRDSLISFGLSTSKEPDYDAAATSLDVSQEVYGGMTTVSLGFTRGADKVRQKNNPGFSERVTHWHYRLGVTQVLSPRWLMSLNVESINDDGFLGNPYRVARVFGAAVPERNPRTRSSKSVKVRAIGDLGSRNAIRGEYRYFWDTWDIRAHTFELGYSRYFGDRILADAFVRASTQGAALFYSDNAQVETTYVSRNRQLSSFKTAAVGAKLAYTVKKVPGRYEIKAHGSYEFVNFKYDDYTDLRNGQPYSFNGNLIQLFVTATY